MSPQPPAFPINPLAELGAHACGRVASESTPASALIPLLSLSHNPVKQDTKMAAALQHVHRETAAGRRHLADDGVGDVVPELSVVAVNNGSGDTQSS